MSKNAMQSPSRRFAGRFVGGAVLFALIYLAGSRFHTFSPGWAFFAAFLLAALIMLSALYTAVMRRMHENVLFNQAGWIYRWRSRRFLLIVVWATWGFVSSYFMLVGMNLYAQRDWFLFFLGIPVFLLIYMACQRFLRPHVNPLHGTRIALQWTRIVMPVTMVVIVAAVTWQFGETRSPASLQQTVAAKRTHITGQPQNSALVSQSLQLFSLASAGQEFVAQHAGRLSKALARGVAALGDFVVFFNACLVLSCLVIPPAEYNRLFGSISPSEVPRPPSPIDVASFTAAVTFVTGFVLVPAFAAVELQLRGDAPSEMQALERKVIERVDQIAGAYFQGGTVEAIEKERAKLLERLAQGLPDLEKEIDAAFEAMKANVDPFLDWYYGLPAEYGRIVHILAGNIEQHIADELSTRLQTADAFKKVGDKLAEVAKDHEQALRDFEQIRDGILRDRKVDTSNKAFEIMRRMSEAELKFVPSPPVAIDLESRLGPAGVAGAVTGFVTAKVTSKVMAKGILKIAAKGVTKLAVSKAGGSLAGAAVGAAVGSVVPGIGTAIGAGIGFLGGLAVGVLVDATLLKLEEHLSRDEFKRQIMESIDEAKTDFKKTVLVGR